MKYNYTWPLPGNEEVATFQNKHDDRFLEFSDIPGGCLVHERGWKSKLN